MLRGLLILVLALAPAVTLAQSNADADRKYEEAQAKFGSGEYGAALVAIDEGLAANPTHLELLLLRGSILFSRRDFEGALLAYEAYLAAGPTGPNKRKVQKLVTNLQVVRETFLQITVSNGPAEVYLESKSFGVFCTAAPDCKRGVMPKEYRVYLAREGFKPVTERIKVQPRSTKELTVTLEELPSKLVIEVAPADAEVSLDGKTLGTGRQELEIAPGDHTLVVTASGHAPLEQTITASQGKPALLQASLKELISVTVSVPGATLFLNGEPITPVDGKITVPPGALTLTAKADGYIDREVEVPAERPRDYRVEITLDKVPPPPPPRPSSWNASKTAAVATTGALAALGYGATVFFALKANGDWSDARERCESDGGPGVVCGPEDYELVEDARSAEATANLTFALGTAAGVGVLWAVNMNEQPQADGRMSLTRKVSMGAAAGVGAAGLAVGIVYGLRAASQRSDSEQNCDDDLVCNRAGYVAAAEALDSADISNLGFAVAAVAAGGAALLWLQAPDAERPGAGSGPAGAGAPGASVQITPTATPEQIGVSVLGRF